jgi:hypothetical protein
MKPADFPFIKTSASESLDGIFEEIKDNTTSLYPS